MILREAEFCVNLSPMAFFIPTNPLHSILPFGQDSPNRFTTLYNQRYCIKDNSYNLYKKQNRRNKFSDQILQVLPLVLNVPLKPIESIDPIQPIHPIKPIDPIQPIKTNMEIVNEKITANPFSFGAYVYLERAHVRR